MHRIISTIALVALASLAVAPASAQPLDIRPTNPQAARATAPALQAQQGGLHIVIMTREFRLYLMEGDRLVKRYGVGIGRDGFGWSGTHLVTRKAEWPDWNPPAEMIARQPNLPRFMAGGPGNPLGARALYLGNTQFRIHGTDVEESIGRRVSSGCIRMLQEDVIDLYNRVPVGTRVSVR